MEMDTSGESLLCTKCTYSACGGINICKGNNLILTLKPDDLLHSMYMSNNGNRTQCPGQNYALSIRKQDRKF